MKVWVYKNVFVVSKRATRSNLPTQRYLVFFSYSFRCCYHTIDLVRSPIIGCKGTSAGQFYNHWKQLVRRPSNFVREDIVLSKATSRVIEGLRSLFIEGSFARVSHIRGTWLYFRGNKRGHPRGASVRYVVVFMHFDLVLSHLAIDFESCHTRLITIQYI